MTPASSQLDRWGRIIQDVGCSQSIQGPPSIACM